MVITDKNSRQPFITHTKIIILIDGENFRNFVKRIIKSENKNPKTNQLDYEEINLDQLIKSVLTDQQKSDSIEIRYYAARIHRFDESDEYSKKLIASQRKLKMTLERQAIKFIISGNVRRREIKIDNNKEYIFAEKGVDVGIAVDIMTIVADKKADAVVLCSSDSDLQPAVKEARKRGLNIIYLGFSINPNKGLQVTCNQSILFRNQEIIKSLTNKKPQRDKSKLR